MAGKRLTFLLIKIKTNTSRYTAQERVGKVLIMRLIFKKITCSNGSSSCQTFCLEIKMVKAAKRMTGKENWGANVIIFS